MTKIMRLLRQPEFHIFIFCLLSILFNWPILGIPAQLGLLDTFLYLFVLWGLLTILLFLIARSVRRAPPRDREGGG